MIDGFTVNNYRLRWTGHPVEDFYAFDQRERILTLADGVTRDPSIHLPNLQTLWGRFRFLRSYPNPSPARLAAELFCESFQKRAAEGENCIRDLFTCANDTIRELNANRNPTPDFLIRDYYACTAIGVVLGPDDKSFNYGFVGDCGLALFDRIGNLQYRTYHGGWEAHLKRAELFTEWKADWRHPCVRWITRKVFRNNPEEPGSFGSLTGEQAALSFLKTGTRAFPPGEILAVYSDGMEEIMFSDDGNANGSFVDALKAWIERRDLDTLQRYVRRRVRTEGTLIVKG